MQSGSSRILGCFSSHPEALLSEKGQVSIQMTIATSGAVTGARVATEGLESSPLADCIIKQVRKLKFPHHDRDGLTIEVPFVYRRK
jgi:hypothetical protein